MHKYPISLKLEIQQLIKNIRDSVPKQYLISFKLKKISKKS